MGLTPLDSNQYPFLASYLVGLPKGLDSYPDATTRSSYNLILQQRLGAILDNEKLPALRRRLKETWAVDDWIPATIYAALCALVRDRLWRTEDEFFAGMLSVANEMFSSILYKAIMFMLSPSLIVQGSSKRYDRFFQGTRLSVVSGGKNKANLELFCPAGLFTHHVIVSLGASFGAAIKAAGGRNPVMSELVEGPGKATFSLSWEA